MSILLSLCLSFMPAIAPSTDVTGDPPGFRTFLNAVRQTETGGLPNEGRGAIGDNGTSLGPYQISYNYWLDAGMTSGTWQDCLYNKEYSEAVMRKYWKRYCGNAYRYGDWEVLARIHNGGPKGARKKATEVYWKTVKRYMNN